MKQSKELPIEYVDVEPMRKWIGSHYKDMKAAAIKISRSHLWEDLLSETVIALLSSKRFRKSIFDEGKEFVFVYSICAFTFYKSKGAFIKKYTYKDSFTDEALDFIESIEEPYNFKKEVVYNSVLPYVIKENKKGNISNYDFKLFILYFYPDVAHNYVSINKDKKELLKGKNSLRKIEQVSGINFQTIRFSILKTINKVKKELDFDVEIETDPNVIIETKKNYNKYLSKF